MKKRDYEYVTFKTSPYQWNGLSIDSKAIIKDKRGQSIPGSDIKIMRNKYGDFFIIDFSSSDLKAVPIEKIAAFQIEGNDPFTGDELIDFCKTKMIELNK